MSDRETNLKILLDSCTRICYNDIAYENEELDRYGRFRIDFEILASVPEKGGVFLHSFTQVLAWITFSVGALFLLMAFYRALFLFLPLFQKRRSHKPTVIHKIGVLISARNEEAVLPYLLDSLHKQDYPADMFRVFVVADNCEDKTAEVARAGGATVFERRNLRRIGKGYALNYLIGEIGRTFRNDPCDAYIVCDADNILEPNYISEMNKVYCDGYPIVGGMRNTKNFSSSWISAGYSIYFMYRSQFLNRSRMQCGTQALISGTGFLIDRGILESAGGWQFFSMSEDTEFTARFLLEGEKIGYAENAILYDEQPVTFRQMWKQRCRWMKGRLQTLKRYFFSMLKHNEKAPRFARMDLLLSVFLLDLVGYLFFASALATTLISVIFQISSFTTFLWRMAAIVTCTYAFYFALGGYTVLSEWDHLHAHADKKLLAVLLYPIFMVMDLPLIVRALFSRARWISVPHSESRSLDEVKSSAALLPPEE